MGKIDEEKATAGALSFAMRFGAAYPDHKSFVLILDSIISDIRHGETRQAAGQYSFTDPKTPYIHTKPKTDEKVKYSCRFSVGFVLFLLNTVLMRLIRGYEAPIQLRLLQYLWRSHNAL